MGALAAAAVVLLGLAAWRLLGVPAAVAPSGAEPLPQVEVRSDRAATRQAIVPLRQEKLVPAAAGVDVRWANLNREAISLLDAGELERAVGAFERCVAAVPSEPVFARNLAEALARLAVQEDERGGEESRALAVQHLSRAAELDPSREDIRRRLEQMTRLHESEKGFTTEISDHFELSYDGERTDLLWSSFEIVMKLERAYQDFGELFGMWPVEGGRPRIRVVLYRKSDFHEATGLGHWAAGVFDGSIRVPLEDLGREQTTLDRVLRHEIAHAFVRESGGTSVPGWLNEGLAQWLETPGLVERRHAIDEARSELAGKTLLPLASLSGTLSELAGDEVGLAYAQSLALCGWIESTYGERLLFEMVAASKEAGGWRETYERWTGTTVEQAIEQLRR